MIFLTVGTQLPFDRLTRAVDEWAAAHPEAEVFGQIADPGPDGYLPKAFEWVPFLGPDAVEMRLSAAALIIGHAGMGTIIGAMTHAKPLVILPRRAHLREQRNDHQMATVKHFGEKPGVTAVSDASAIGPAIDRTLARGAEDHAQAAIAPVAEPRLIEALRTFIHQR